MLYEVTCQYTEGHFVGKYVVPSNDNFRHLRAEFNCHRKSNLHPTTVKHLQRVHKIKVPKIIDFKVRALEEDTGYYTGKQLTL